MKTELVKPAVAWGNSAGVLLPREWQGMEVKVILVDRTRQIKKEVLNILSPYLDNIQGIYLTGSYARNEQSQKSDIDVIAISNTNKEISSGKYHIFIYSLESIRKTVKNNPILIFPRILEAKTILNKSLLKELQEIPISKNRFKGFFEETRRIIKINKEFIEMQKIESKKETSELSHVIYSLILRLRGLFLVKGIITKTPYSNKDFAKWIKHEIGQKEFEKLYAVYRDVKNDKKVKQKIKIDTIEKLLHILEKKLHKLDGD